jgi:hypothetical protein
MGSKGRMWGLPQIVRWNVTYWLLSSLCEKHSTCYSLTRSHISSILRQFPSLPVQLKNSLRIPWALRLSESCAIPIGRRSGQQFGFAQWAQGGQYLLFTDGETFQGADDISRGYFFNALYLFIDGDQATFGDPIGGE